MAKKITFLFLVIFSFFLVLRLLGVDQIYHQDEYRWAMIADPDNGLLSPHPPVTKLLLTWGAGIFGYGCLRLVPLLFSSISFVLIYLISRKISGSIRPAVMAICLFSLNIYSMIAGLQIDIDGAILPFAILLSYYAYLSWLSSKSKFWLSVLILSVILGFLTKLSYALFLGALAVDFGWQALKQKQRPAGKILRTIGLILVFALAIASLVYFFLSSQFQFVIDYAKHFRLFNLGSRSYLDLVFKVFKSFAWLSPILALPAVAGLFDGETFKKYRVWYIYLLFNFLFYLVIFDFTTLTIERYFMFLIIPCVLISGEVLGKMLGKFSLKKDISVVAWSAAAFSALSWLITSFSYRILPLNPKIAYLNQIRSLNFNFLIPFSGGSGPIGFYMSAEFIIIFWIISLVLALASRMYASKAKYIAIVFIIFGFGYNIIFSNEFLFGGLYGSPNKLAQASVKYIAENPGIKEVITYNDIGAYELKMSGKYSSRFYTALTRDYTQKLSEFRGYYLVVNFPFIGDSERHWNLIKDCPKLEFRDRDIKSYIIDCSKK